MKLHAPTTQEEAESMVTRGPSMETGWKIVTDRKRHSPEYLDGAGTTARYGVALSCLVLSCLACRNTQGHMRGVPLSITARTAPRHCWRNNLSATT